MINIPTEAVDAMKAEVLAQVDRYGFVEVSPQVYQTLNWDWLFAHLLMVAETPGPLMGVKTYVIYRSRRGEDE